MVIIKELKFGKFLWNEEDEKLVIFDENGNHVALRKGYVFSLIRFCIRITQRYFNAGIRKRKEK